MILFAVFDDGVVCGSSFAKNIRSAEEETMINDQILTTFEWFSAEMKRAGRGISFPIDTDPQKTYMYRTVAKFVKTVSEYKLSDDMIRGMIQSIVKHAKVHRLLDRGVSLLTMRSMLDICSNDLQQQGIEQASMIDELKRCKDFIKNKDLLARARRGGYCNLIRWYQTGQLTLPFVAISKNCMRAVTNLSESEREVIPPRRDILKSRITTLRADDLSKIKTIMGSDLITLSV